jgi:jasmonate ZIM domain-containing protein
MEGTSSFAMACNLLSRYVKQNGAAAGELGLGIKGGGEPRFLEEKLGS